MLSVSNLCFVLLLFNLLLLQVKSRICTGLSQYDRCSTTNVCGCFLLAGATNVGMCLYKWEDCSKLATCDPTNNHCNESYQACVQHPQCHNRPVCYPVPLMNDQICPPMTVTNITTTTLSSITNTTTSGSSQQKQLFPLRCPSTVQLNENSRWQQNGVIVAGGNGEGNESSQVWYPEGLFVDDDQTVYVAEFVNDRIAQWKVNGTSGQTVAGGNGHGNGAHQLKYPRDMIIDKQTESLIICDSENNRIVRWPLKNGTRGATIASGIYGWGLTMSEDGSIYVVDPDQDVVRKYRRGESVGTVVAGGNGRGSRLDQLFFPKYVFVDRDHSVYVSDTHNHRVVKWVEGAKEGIIVAGGYGWGHNLTHMGYTEGVVVDQMGTVYVADGYNARVMRWPKGSKQGSVIVGGNGRGNESNQLYWPEGLTFDRYGNLYVNELDNHRVQRFDLIQ